MAHHILLVPGFFGFTGTGDLGYFVHVRDALAEAAHQAGLDGEIRVVRTDPTGSLPGRAARVAEAIREVLDGSGAEVSLVCHSSGGLDARLVVTPNVSLPTEVDVERCARAVRAILTVATPHRGTPTAHFFNNLLGQQILRLLSISTMYSLRAGRLPIRAVVRMARLLRDPEAKPQGVVDQIFADLLADFSVDRRRAIESFFRSVGGDQDLLAQITPASMDVFNASTQDRADVRYECVITCARPPGLGAMLKVGLGVYAQATYAMYVALYRIARRTLEERAVWLTPVEAEVMRRAYLGPVDLAANDGMVPSVSQLWGEVVAAVWADHLDVIGHFHHPTHVPPHFDWLASGTGFTRSEFEHLWRKVAMWLARPRGGKERLPRQGQ